jgi:hypothetical protein
VAPYPYIIWELNNRPLVAAVQRHSLSPHRHEHVFVLMSDQVSHPYKSGRITGLYASLFTFFDDTLDVSYRFININRHFRADRRVHDGVSLKGSQEMIGSLAFAHQNPPTLWAAVTFLRIPAIRNVKEARMEDSAST